MTTIKAEVVGLQGLNNLFSKVKQAADPERALDEITAVLLNRIRARFLNQTDPDGNKWPESFAAKKRAGAGGTLFDTGTLFHSIQGFNEGPGVRSIGTDVPYAKVHQEGLEGNPVRVFLGFSDEDVDIANLIIFKRIQQAGA